MKVILINLGLILLIFVVGLSSLFLYSRFFGDQDLAINNTTFNEDDLDEESKNNENFSKRVKGAWVLSKNEKLKQLRENGLSDKYIIQVKDFYLQEDPVLQSKPKKNFSTRVRSFFKDKVIYDVEYSFDQHFRRITPSLSSEGKDPLIENAFAAVFGGSFAFGDGVAPRETLSYYFKRMSGIPTFNYGVQGYGPQHMYLQIKNGPLVDQVPPYTKDKAVIVYLYMPHHRNRLIGTMKELHWSRGRFPYLEIKNDGPPIFKGNYREARPFSYRLLEALAGNQVTASFLSSFYGDFPDPFSRSSTFKLCRLLEETQKELQSQIKWSKFIVVIAPKAPVKDDLVEGCLRKKNIDYIDTRNVKVFTPENMSILYGVENHYRPEVYQYFSSRIVDRLKEGLVKVERAENK
jgi:hypothetical protein